MGLHMAYSNMGQPCTRCERHLTVLQMRHTYLTPLGFELVTSLSRAQVILG